MDVLILLRFAMTLWVWLAALWLTQGPEGGTCAQGLALGSPGDGAAPTDHGLAALVWLVALTAQAGVLVALRPPTAGVRRPLLREGLILLVAGVVALALWTGLPHVAPLTC